MFCIAPSDITEALVVDRDFCLKNINFDVAMKVDDKDEMGKIEEKSMWHIQPDQGRLVVKRCLAETRHTRELCLISNYIGLAIGF